MSTKIKICGITSVSDAIAVVNAGVDFIGLVLSPSPRRVDFKKVAGIASAINGRASTVGVFASEADLIAFDRQTSTSLDYYQVYFDHDGLPVRRPSRGWIRAFWIHDIDSSLPVTNSDLLLCDFKKVALESMRQWCSTLSDTIRERTVIAGNLTADNVGAIVSAFRPFGVDVARGVESAPGVKDLGQIERFIQSVRNA